MLSLIALFFDAVLNLAEQVSVQDGQSTCSFASDRRRRETECVIEPPAVAQRPVQPEKVSQPGDEPAPHVGFRNVMPTLSHAVTLWSY
jgi:hypothetical protein